MCGIAGIVRWDGRPPSGEVVESMCHVMAHRGPDDQGLYVDDSAALGMRRLSIIDLSTGHQPVQNEDGTLWVVFNGEIYNFKELRRDLVRQGHRFYTTTDTEVLVHLYEEVGPHVVDPLRGMFTFAIWDAKRRHLFLARDRMGIKPLYYAQIDGGLVFASELKSMLQVPEIERRLSWTAVSHLFTFLATPSAQSIIDGVQKLEPAHRAMLGHDGRLRLERYWDVQFEPNLQASENELAEQLRALLAEAVELADDEVKYARQVASSFETDHHELVLEPQELHVAEELPWFLDEPFGDSSAISTYIVSKLAGQHVKVVLTGDGGDELFAGYDNYVVEAHERSYDQIPRAFRTALSAIGRAMPEGMKGRNFLRHLALQGGRRYLDASTLFDRSEQARLFWPDIFSKVGAADPWSSALRHLAADDWLSGVQCFDFHNYLPLDILTKVDRMSMAHSIESRPALLDHKVVEFAATIPVHMRLRDRNTRYLFKRAMRGLLPDEIIDRRKQGIAVPLARWFRGDWSGFLRDVLLSDTCRQRGIFNVAYIERLLRMHERGRSLELHLWTLLSFEQWCRTFLDRAPTGPALARGYRLVPVLAPSAA